MMKLKRLKMNLKLWRRKFNVTQEEMATMAGISRYSIIRLEGNVNIRSDAIKSIERAVKFVESYGKEVAYGLLVSKQD